MTGALATILVICSALAGAGLGSYAGVVRARGWGASVRGRSRCSTCDRELRWYELVPFLSFSVQRGRCRTCGAAIGWEALVVEVLGAAVGLGVSLPVLLVLGVY